MTSKIYHDREWLHADDAPRPADKPPTRAEMQRRINTLYGQGKITHAEWSGTTDQLSNSGKWTAAGAVKAS